MPCGDTTTHIPALCFEVPSTVVGEQSGAGNSSEEDRSLAGRGRAHVVELPDLEAGGNAPPDLGTDRSATPTAEIAGHSIVPDRQIDGYLRDRGLPPDRDLSDAEEGARAPPIDAEVHERRRATIPETPDGTGAVEKSCGLTTRRWHQLCALGLGLLQVVFSVDNALSKDAFEISNAKEFVFSASAAMESVGVAMMLLAAVCREMHAEERQQDGRNFMLEGFGSPLGILVNGVRQKERSLTKLGHFGAMCQAAVVSVIGLVLLQRVDARAFVIMFYVIFLLLAGFCLISNSYFCENWFRDVLSVSSLDSALDPEDTTVGITYVLVMLPLGIEVAEVVLLVLGGESWKATVLVVLDIAVTAAVLFPHGHRHFMRNYPDFTRRIARDWCPGFPCPVFRRLDVLLRILFA